MKLEELKKEIEIVFADVKLENGIGYYEAGAIDDYLNPTSKAYKALKAKDEREDWRKVLISIRDKDRNFLDSSRYCFMEAKGLYFLLPVLLTKMEFECLGYMFFNLMNNQHHTNISEMLAMLTPAQEKCVLDAYKVQINFEGEIAYYSDFGFSRESAIKKIQETDDFIIWKFLKEYFENKHANNPLKS